MIKTGLFDKAYLATLKKAVDVYARRHQVTSENIANVETPGYRTQELKFEDMLAGARRRLHGVTTHANHLPVGRRDLAGTDAEQDDLETSYDNGTNNVDIDREMAGLATNDLQYRLATRLLSMRYSMLGNAIKGTVR